jgi:protein-disulfide isomerase
MVVGVIVLGEVLRGGNEAVPAHSVSAEGRTLGSADAPVKMVVYLDFQCPYCGNFTREAQPEIEKKYIEPGQLSLEIRPIAFIGAESLWAAEAAACAGDQGRFLDYHDKLFEKQGQENSGAFAIDKLKGFAVDLGLDTEAFNSCLDSQKYAQQVRQETDEAISAGIDSTPTFFIGDTKLSQVRSFQDLYTAIDKALGKAS